MGRPDVEGVIPLLQLTKATAVKQMQPARKPMAKDAHVGTNPAHGVMQARPATAPVKAPIMLGLPVRNQLIASQVHIATEAAMSVLTKA